jgi:hypothetical protein
MRIKGKKHFERISIIKNYNNKNEEKSILEKSIFSSKMEKR